MLYGAVGASLLISRIPQFPSQGRVDACLGLNLVQEGPFLSSGGR